MKKLIFILSTLMLISCNQGQNHNQKSFLNDEAFERERDSIQHLIDSTISAQQTWNYKEVKSQMNGKVTLTSTIFSLNTVDLDFPYEETRGGLMVISNQDYTRVYFTLTEGQLEPKDLWVRFDRNAPQFYKVHEDNPAEPTVRIEDESFFEKMVLSDTTRIQVDLYGQGSEVFKFHTANFDISRIE